MTVCAALAAAAASGTGGLVDAESGRALTWAEVWPRARAMAAWLREANVGERVAVVLPNSLPHAVLFLGAACDGVGFAALHPGLPPSELASKAKALGCTHVVCAPAMQGELEAQGLGPLPLSAKTGLDALPEPLAPHALRPTDERTLLSLVQTSGTTGESRACRILHGGALHSARATAACFGRGSTSRYLTPLPLFHTNAQVIGVLTSLVSHGTLALCPRLPPERLWAAAERAQVEGVSLVPALVHDLVKLGVRAPDTVKYAVASSAPLSAESHARFQDVTGVPLRFSYGLSELSGFATFGFDGQPPGTVGRAHGCEVTLGDGDEVRLHGPAVFDGYEGDAEATARTIRDGWLHTGDVGVLEAGGLLTIRGRLKELINRGGEKVTPLDVETVLLRLPSVKEVCVFGWPDARLGETVAAALVVEGAGPSRDDLEAHCLELLGEFQVPSHWWTVAALPRGPTQKVLRRELVAWVQSRGSAL